MEILSTIGSAIGKGIATIGIVLGGWFGFHQPEVVQPIVQQTVQPQILGADTMSYVGGSVYYIAGSGISSSATSIPLTSLTIKQNGYYLQDSDFADTFYLTIEPGDNTKQEFASCTTVGTNTGGAVTLSGCTRGLSPIAPYTASTTLRFTHAGSSKVIFSNSPAFYNQFLAKGNDETITGVYTFSTLPESSVVPTTAVQLTTKSYVDGVAFGSSTVAIAAGGTATTSFITNGVIMSGMTATSSLSASTSPTIAGNLAINGTLNTVGTTTLATTTISYLTITTATGLASNADIQIFTASSTWTKPTGAKKIFVQGWGAGGAGGAKVTNDGGGGGGGAYKEVWIDASELNATTSVVIGAGGVGVLNGNGNAGGNTTFATTTFYGGGGGGHGSVGTGHFGAGGGGGGALSAGTTANASTTAGVGGSPVGGAAGVASIFGGGGGGNGGGSNLGGTSWYGGGGGSTGASYGGNSSGGSFGGYGSLIGVGGEGSANPGLSGTNGKLIITTFF